MPDTPLYYIAMHIRSNDFYVMQDSSRYWQSSQHLKHIINRNRSVYKGCKIYIMSDIQDRRYFDFPELEALVSKNNDSEIDNAMLYSVEKNILQYAHTKIILARNSPEILYMNSSFNIPLLSIPPEYLHLKYLHQKLLLILRKTPGIKQIKIAIRKIRRLMN